MKKALYEQITLHDMYQNIVDKKKTLTDLVNLWIWEEFMFEKIKHNWMIVLLLELTFWYLIPCFQQSIPPFPPFIPHPFPPPHFQLCPKTLSVITFRPNFLGSLFVFWFSLFWMFTDDVRDSLDDEIHILHLQFIFI